MKNTSIFPCLTLLLFCRFRANTKNYNVQVYDSSLGRHNIPLSSAKSLHSNIFTFCRSNSINVIICEQIILFLQSQLDPSFLQSFPSIDDEAQVMSNGFSTLQNFVSLLMDTNCWNEKSNIFLHKYVNSTLDTANLLLWRTNGMKKIRSFVPCNTSQWTQNVDWYTFPMWSHPHNKDPSILACPSTKFSLESSSTTARAEMAALEDRNDDVLSIPSSCTIESQLTNTCTDESSTFSYICRSYYTLTPSVNVSTPTPCEVYSFHYHTPTNNTYFESFLAKHIHCTVHILLSSESQLKSHLSYPIHRNVHFHLIRVGGTNEEDRDVSWSASPTRTKTWPTTGDNDSKVEDMVDRHVQAPILMSAADFMTTYLHGEHAPPSAVSRSLHLDCNGGEWSLLRALATSLAPLPPVANSLCTITMKFNLAHMYDDHATNSGSNSSSNEVASMLRDVIFFFDEYITKRQFKVWYLHSYGSPLDWGYIHPFLSEILGADKFTTSYDIGFYRPDCDGYTDQHKQHTRLDRNATSQKSTMCDEDDNTSTDMLNSPTISNCSYSPKTSKDENRSDTNVAGGFLTYLLNTNQLVSETSIGKGLELDMLKVEALADATLDEDDLTCNYYSIKPTRSKYAYKMCLHGNRKIVEINDTVSVMFVDLISAEILRLGSWPDCDSLLLLYHSSVYSYEESLRQKILANGIFLDVGANIGSCSLFMAANGVNVVAFEPAFRNYYTFVKAVESNIDPIRKRIKIFPYALGNSTTDAVAYSEPSNTGNTVLDQPVLHHKMFLESVVQRPQAVRVVRLDDMISPQLTNSSVEAPYIVLMKIDTQGYELQVLQGAAHLLRNRLILMIKIELSELHFKAQNTSSAALCNYILQFDYKLSVAVNGSVLSIDNSKECALYDGIDIIASLV